MKVRVTTEALQDFGIEAGQTLDITPDDGFYVINDREYEGFDIFDGEFEVVNG